MTERKFEPGDLPQVMAVYHDAVHTLAAPFYAKEQLDSWAPPDAKMDRWKERLAPLQTILTEHEGLVAGFASYNTAGHLDLLFVDPRFARRGVATRLCSWVENELRAGGVSRIFTEASLAARSFFERIGFRVVAEETVECRGSHLRRYAMEKIITSPNHSTEPTAASGTSAAGHPPRQP